VFGKTVSARLQALITRRVEMQDVGEDPLDQLLEAKPRDVSDWLAARATLADGAPKLLPVADGDVATAVLAEAEARAGAWLLRSGRKTRSAWDVLRVGLLLELCAEPVTSVASRVGRSHTSARRTYAAHAAFLRADPIYRARAGELGCEIVRRCHAE
jgi:hypothetical protein